MAAVKLYTLALTSLWAESKRKLSQRMSTKLKIIIGFGDPRSLFQEGKGDSSENGIWGSLLEPRITAWLYDNKQKFDLKLVMHPGFSGQNRSG